MDLTIAFTDAAFEAALPVIEPVSRVLAGIGVTAEFILTAPQPEQHATSSAGYGLRVAAAGDGSYGAQLRKAVEAARGDWLITLDAPRPDDAALVFGFWHRRHEADLLVASRYTQGGSYRMPWLRRFLSRNLNRLYRIGLSVPVQDLSSARRMYRTSLLRKVIITGSDFDALMEVLIRLMSRGASVAEVPWDYESREHRQKPGTMFRLMSSSLATFRKLHALRNSVDFPDYDYRAYDSRIWFQRYWQRKRFSIIRRFEGEDPGLELDAGCGSSRIITTRPNMIAMDINLNRLRFLRKVTPRRLQATAGELPFPDNTFDTVISSQVIEHTPERTCINECARVLRPGGNLVIGTPDYGRIWWPVTEKIYGWVKRGGYAEEHITHYTYPMLAAEITEAGCEVQEHAYICGGELIIRATKKLASP